MRLLACIFEKTGRATADPLFTHSTTARREREKAADLIRKENLDGLFTAPTLSHETAGSTPATGERSRASSISSKAAFDHKDVVDSDVDEDDEEGQYVTLPTLGMGMGAGDSLYALGSASTFDPSTSTFDPSTPGTSRSAGSSSRGGDAWSQRATGEHGEGRGAVRDD